MNHNLHDNLVEKDPLGGGNYLLQLESSHLGQDRYYLSEGSRCPRILCIDNLV